MRVSRFYSPRGGLKLRFSKRAFREHNGGELVLHGCLALGESFVGAPGGDHCDGHGRADGDTGGFQAGDALFQGVDALEPAEKGSAGSFFCNPVIGREYFARVVATARQDNGPDYQIPCEFGPGPISGPGPSPAIMLQKSLRGRCAGPGPKVWDATTVCDGPHCIMPRMRLERTSCPVLWNGGKTRWMLSHITSSSGYKTFTLNHLVLPLT